MLKLSSEFLACPGSACVCSGQSVLGWQRLKDPYTLMFLEKFPSWYNFSTHLTYSHFLFKIYRFRADSLYICDWPGCVHPGEKRMYKLFRGIFKNFKQSHVWRNLRDHQAKKSELSCAFCSALSTWDMVTTFCLRRSFEYHEDGEPVVRAYVCENGHVAGAWTDRPLYNLWWRHLGVWCNKLGTVDSGG